MSEYTDPKNNKHRIIQSVRISKDNKSELENQIVEELYRIFIEKLTTKAKAK